ncbi:MAG: MucBP domain-containing protein [Clostridia bacterium]|nr:MucBP domain-containing protein [Clostridia bacterium]
MTYFNRHRAGLIKKNHIRGERLSIASPDTTLNIDNSAGVGIEKISLEGTISQKTDQKSFIYTGDNGIEISLKSKNLLDYKDLQRKLTGSSVTSGLPMTAFELEGGKTYTLGFDFEFLDGIRQAATFDIGRGEGWYQADIKQSAAFSNKDKGRFVYTFKTPSDLGDYTKLAFRLRTEKGAGYTVSLSKFTLALGDTDGEYIEYFEPMTITVNAPLYSLGDISDRLIIDRVGGRVMREEKIHLLALLGGESFKSEIVQGVSAFTTTLDIPSAEGRQGLCTHFDYFNGDEGASFLLEGERLCFLNTGYDLGSIFKTFISGQDLVGTPVKIMYVRNKSVLIDYSNEEWARALLSLNLPYGSSGIIEITATTPITNLQASYFTLGEGDRVDLTVQYMDTEGNQIKEPSTYSVRKDSAFQIISPHIDGYSAIEKSTRGRATKSTEISLVYRKES